MLTASSGFRLGLSSESVQMSQRQCGRGFNYERCIDPARNSSVLSGMLWSVELALLAMTPWELWMAERPFPLGFVCEAQDSTQMIVFRVHSVFSISMRGSVWDSQE